MTEQQTGDATADGSVKVSYGQPGSLEPVHVLAARAEMKHDTQVAKFYGVRWEASAVVAGSFAGGCASA